MARAASGRLNVFTARTVLDSDCGRGAHHGEQLFENDGFVVQFFDRGLIARLADGFRIVEVAEFEEGSLPRHLFRVTLEKLPRE